MIVKKNFFIRLITSLFVTFYLLFLTLLAVKITFHNYNFSIRMLNLFVFPYISIIFFFTHPNIKIKLNFKKDMFYFCGYSLISIFLIFVLIKILLIKNISIVEIILSLILISSINILVWYKILILIEKILFFTFTKNKHLDNEKKIYTVYEFKEFLKSADIIINQSNRLNIKTGIILIYPENMEKLKQKFSEEEIKFIRKQLIFILSENSRRYEPWGRTEDKFIYMKIIQYKNDFEFQFTIERFLKLINEHDFKIYEKSVKINFRALGYKINFNGSESNYIESSYIIINKLINKIKTQKKKLLIIDKLK